MRIKLLLAYKGTGFHGWQIQDKPNPPPTIQGEVQKAFHTVTGLNPVLFASGRTDSGVHAHGQVAHLDLPDSGQWLRMDWRHALNSLLPSAIRILRVERAGDNFHARKDALAKTYIYNFWTETAFVPPHLTEYVWSCGALDMGLVRSCIPQLLGEHDFASFQNRGTLQEDTVRTLFALELEKMPQLEYYPPHAPFLRLSITANGFLKQMCRNLAGLLWKIGRAKLDAGMIQQILAAKNREALNAPTAPASGLCLAKVYYSKFAAISGSSVV